MNAGSMMYTMYMGHASTRLAVVWLMYFLFSHVGPLEAGVRRLLACMLMYIY